MKRIIIFLLLILGIFSCNNPTKEIKKDLAELKAALEEINKEYEPIQDKIEGFRLRDIKEAKERNGLGLGLKQSEEIRLQSLDKAKNEIKSLKFPETLKVKKIIEKLEKNISKVKSRNQMEIFYYQGINNIILETKEKIDYIDNFKNTISEYKNMFDMGKQGVHFMFDNIINEISRLENFANI